jgi:hypothetical protein
MLTGPGPYYAALADLNREPAHRDSDEHSGWPSPPPNPGQLVVTIAVARALAMDRYTGSIIAAIIVIHVPVKLPGQPRSPVR